MTENPKRDDDEPFPWLRKARAVIDRKTAQMSPEEEIVWTHSEATETLKRMESIGPDETARRWDELFREVGGKNKPFVMPQTGKVKLGKSRTKGAVGSLKAKKTPVSARKRIITAKLPK